MIFGRLELRRDVQREELGEKGDVEALAELGGARCAAHDELREVNEGVERALHKLEARVGAVFLPLPNRQVDEHCDERLGAASDLRYVVLMLPLVGRRVA